MTSPTTNPTKPVPEAAPDTLRTKSGPMASGQSSWNTSAFAFSPNTNVMDQGSMPSEKSEAARLKAEEVMAALRSGEPGAADRVMGAQKESGSKGILPLQWLGSKFKRGKGEKPGKVMESDDDSVIR